MSGLYCFGGGFSTRGIKYYQSQIPLRQGFEGQVLQIINREQLSREIVVAVSIQSLIA